MPVSNFLTKIHVNQLIETLATFLCRSIAGVPAIGHPFCPPTSQLRTVWWLHLFGILSQPPGPGSNKKMMSHCSIWSMWQGHEPLLKREGTYVYTKKGNYSRVLSLKSVYSMNKTVGRRKMFITIGHMRQVDWAAAQHLFSPFSSPFYGVKLLYDWVLRNERSDRKNLKAGKKAKPEWRPESFVCADYFYLLCSEPWRSRNRCIGRYREDE